MEIYTLYIGHQNQDTKEPPSYACQTKGHGLPIIGEICQGFLTYLKRMILNLKMWKNIPKMK